MKQVFPQFMCFLNVNHHDSFLFKNFFLILSIVIVTYIAFLFLYMSEKNKKHGLTIKPPNKEQVHQIVKKEINVKEETIQNIIKGLHKLEREKYFLDINCNAYNVAKRINTNTTYLSKVMNIHYQKNFNTYINELRIQYIIHQLNHDKRYLSYNIQSLSKEVGYKSPDSFTKAFKTYTGLLPSIYIKNMQSKNELVNS
ncbi:Transcriptional regulator, AraC family (fragment) [Tenacibaculum amylolyticum]